FLKQRDKGASELRVLYISVSLRFSFGSAFETQTDTENYGILLNSSSLKSKSGFGTSIFISSAFPCGFKVNVTKPLGNGYTIEPRHLILKVSKCQCSKSPTKFGDGPNRTTNLPSSSLTFASPYIAPE